MPKRIMIIAGEASGDLHGGKLVNALRAKNPGVEIFGVGGDKMAAAGMELLYHVQNLAYIGFSEIIRHLPFFKQVFDVLVATAMVRRPDVVVLIDYPGLNLRLAKKLKSLGFKIFYFITPQVWAWRQGRAKKMAAFIDRMAVIFDFEVDFFRRYGIDTHFVGHPLVDGLKLNLDDQEFFARFGLKVDRPLLALLPGSRRQEINGLLPTMLATAKIIRLKYPNLQIAVSQADTITIELLAPHLDADFPVTIVKGATYELMHNATAAAVASGTATLETAYFQTPFVLLYRVSPLSFFIGKRLVKIPHIGLVNIVGREEIAREFIQDALQPAAISAELEKCLFDAGFRAQKKAKLALVKQKLGEPGAADKTADLVLDLIA